MALAIVHSICHFWPKPKFQPEELGQITAKRNDSTSGLDNLGVTQAMELIELNVTA
jgi:hypothetical protein